MFELKLSTHKHMHGFQINAKITLDVSSTPIVFMTRRIYVFNNIFHNV